MVSVRLGIRGIKYKKLILVIGTVLILVLIVGSYFKHQNNKLQKFIPKRYEEDGLYDFRQLPNIPTANGEYHLEAENDEEAQRLKTQVRVLCMIITNAANLPRKAMAVKDTWAKRCNKYVFITDEEDKKFGTVGVHAEGRDHLTAKTIAGFKYVYENYRNDYDWFFKTDDDTYVIVENLRYLLSHYHSTQSVYIGHHFDNVEIANKAGYMSGGGGYALSKAALEQFVTVGVNESHPLALCRRDYGAEDAAIGRCMNKLGIKPAFSLDVHKRETFHPFNVFTHLTGDFPSWYNKYKQNPVKGRDSLSDYSITFHYVDPIMMYTMDHLIYHLHTYGIVKGKPPKKVFKIEQT
ncbi:unnamed protein product [Owenia fusiformis]|uniref:N-acetylgalactosaminide beta-1,3-galactosyltransferase n=1 Tax=Owenia fusiformis TaxID=6347 RepID=A0A8J1U6U2_OWEFU|nr:unnamed protein product [Owenia fusiformis]